MSDVVISISVKDLWMDYVSTATALREAESPVEAGRLRHQASDEYEHYASFVRTYGGSIQPPLH